MEDKKYYTPDITEFHINYECEYQDMAMQKTPWHPVVIDSDLFGIACSTYEHGTPEWEDNMENTFKTKYLDKEDIESEGWGAEVELTELTTRWHKGEYVIVRNSENGRLRIAIHDQQIYDGQCPSINQLRIIQKLLGIK